MNLIKKVKGDIIPGIFEADISFSPGLNIVSGSNGVGKTFLLKYILQHRTNQNFIEFDNPDNNLRNISSFDPKRNATKNLIEQAQQLIRRDANSKKNAINQFLNKKIQDDGFQSIKSVSEYLMLSFEEYRDGQDLTPTEAAEKVKNDFTKILSQVFENYQIHFLWNKVSRRPEFSIIKNDEHLQPNLLSSGENALITLIFALFYSVNETQVYLIDEPEIHLNWQLEEKLFTFFDLFAKENNKQLIVVTHSRICFIENFINKSIFLVWNQDNQVEVKNIPTQDIVTSLSGDFVKIIGGITAKKKLVYVEDWSHEKILNLISSLLDTELEIQRTGNSSEVFKLSKNFKKLNIDNVYFLIDNDNKEYKDKNSTINLIQLNKYCIENYFLDIPILSKIDKRNEPDKSNKTIEILIKEAINQVNQQNFVVIKKLLAQETTISQDILDRIDASQFIKTLLSSLGYNNKEDFFKEYLTLLNSENTLKEYFCDLDLLL